MTKRFNRGTGLLIINVVNSNPNGDPDADSEPRTFDDGRGLISPVSFKRKVRDLVADKGDVFTEAASAARPLQGTEILESRGRDRKSIGAMGPAEFIARFWDARVFGNTFARCTPARTCSPTSRATGYARCSLMTLTSRSRRPGVSTSA